MVEKSQEYLRLALAAAALLVGLSIAYHYVIYIPEKDREAKLEAQTKAQTDAAQATDKQEEAEKNALARRTNYRICLSAAQADYSSRWDASCKRRSEEADNSRAQCIAGGTNEDWCRSSYPSIPAADCSLPSSMSNEYDAMLKEDRKRCLDEANAGVLDSSQ